MKFIGYMIGAVMLSGCATAYWGSAPAGDGQHYVVGQYDGDATIWKCPSKQKGDCQKVSVESHD